MRLSEQAADDASEQSGGECELLWRRIKPRHQFSTGELSWHVLAGKQVILRVFSEILKASNPGNSMKSEVFSLRQFTPSHPYLLKTKRARLLPHQEYQMTTVWLNDGGAAWIVVEAANLTVKLETSTPFNTISNTVAAVSKKRTDH